jgi:uncharacterized protein YbdZ (MbtH family)
MERYDQEEDTTIYKVVVNHEEQYSIWPADRENPLGWRDAGTSGPKADCLAYIAEVWTDMRPLSLRKQMEEVQSRVQSSTTEAPGSEQATISQGDMAQDTLVRRLAVGDHPVEASLPPDKRVQALKECIDRGYVHIKFTATRGGTNLGVRLDRDAVDLSRADFDNQTGTVHLVGNLTLDYVPVRCIADIALETLTGQGHLEIVEA